MLPSDYHLHTHNSGDSTAPMADMLDSAINMGLTEICFTEHMDMGFPELPAIPPDTFTLDTNSYRTELFHYKELYHDKITIKYGVELGLQTDVADDNQSYISANSFDFVIGSIHLLEKKDPFYPEFWEGKEESDVLRNYFETTLENIRLFSDFDVLGHLDYIVRYTPSKGHKYNCTDYFEITDEILKLLISKDKGLDLNTKALFRGMGNPNPHEKILRRYKELGGRILTFGSDAHNPKEVAGCFEEARDLALSCGFTEYCTFTERAPEFHAL